MDFSNLWQDPLWEAFQKGLGHRTWRVEHGTASALMVLRALPFGKKWIEIPRGPLFENEEDLKALIHNIRAIGRREGAMFIRCNPYDPRFTKFYHRGKRTPHDFHPEASLVLDLSLDHDALLSQMKPKGRYNIKVAQKHEVKVLPSDNIDAFYELLSGTGNRDGFGIHPKEYYEEMVDQLDGSLELLMAYYEDKPIAGGLFVFLNDWAIYYYGASDHEHRRLMAPYLVQWEAIKLAQKRGCKWYDFLGIAPNGNSKHPWAGVTDFKKKFGGEERHYPPARDLVLRPFWYTLYRLYKAFKK